MDVNQPSEAIVPEHGASHDLLDPAEKPSSGWFAVCSGMAASFALVLSEFVPLGLLDELSRDLDVTEGRAGLFIVLPGLAACIGAPLVTVLAGGMDRRRVLLLLSLAVMVSNIWVVVAPSFAVALVGWAVLGFAVGGFWSIGPPTATRYVAPKNGTRAAALVIGGISMATVISLPLGAFIVEFADWRWAFVVAAAFAFIAVSLELAALPRLAPSGPVGWSLLLGIFATSRARQCLVITVAAFSAHFATYTYITPFLNRTGLPDGALPFLLLVFGLVGVASNLMGGWILATAPRASDGGQAMFVSILQLSLAGGSAFGGVLVDWLGVRTDYELAGLLALLAGLATTWWLRGLQTSAEATFHDEPHVSTTTSS